MQVEVKRPNKQTNKSKWGAHLPKVFSNAEEIQVAEFLNELRLAEMKLLYLQQHVTYDLESLLRWLRAKKYTTWIDNGNQRQSSGKVLGIQHIGSLQVGVKITLNLFNTTDKNNNHLHITRVDNTTWETRNDTIGNWLDSMVERKLYPNGAAGVVFDRFVKGKKNIGNNKAEEYLAAFDRVRGKAKGSAEVFTGQFNTWKETIGVSTIELLREFLTQYKQLKFEKAA